MKKISTNSLIYHLNFPYTQFDHSKYIASSGRRHIAFSLHTIIIPCLREEEDVAIGRSIVADY